MGYHLFSAGAVSHCPLPWHSPRVTSGDSALMDGFARPDLPSLDLTVPWAGTWVRCKEWENGIMAAIRPMYSKTLMEPIKSSAWNIYGYFLEAHGVQHIHDEDDEHNAHQNGILKAKHQLHGGCMGQDAVMATHEKESPEYPAGTSRSWYSPYCPQLASGNI